MAEFDFTQAIGEARAKYESIAKALDVDRLKADIKDLETQAAAPGLWDCLLYTSPSPRDTR